MSKAGVKDKAKTGLNFLKDLGADLRRQITGEDLKATRRRAGEPLHEYLDRARENWDSKRKSQKRAKAKEITKKAFIGFGYRLSPEDAHGLSLGFPYLLTYDFDLDHRPEATEGYFTPTFGLGLAGPNIGLRYKDALRERIPPESEEELLKESVIKKLAERKRFQLKAEHKNPKGGLNAKGRAAYNKATGGNLKPPQPKGGARRDSFCARMKGMKAKLTSAKTANDPNSRINKALRAWNC